MPEISTGPPHPSPPDKEVHLLEQGMNELKALVGEIREAANMGRLLGPYEYEGWADRLSTLPTGDASGWAWVPRRATSAMLHALLGAQQHSKLDRQRVDKGRGRWDR